ncbi:MAG: tetratricopeptide repeat protein [bacterium]|nr:tetratricopeptide repeat protein [bacterium]
MNIISVVLILISLIIIIVIVFKKFPLLATLDIKSIPAEKEAKIKEQIISARLKRNVIKWWLQFVRFTGPLVTVLNNLFSLLYKRLQRLKDEHQKPVANLDNNNATIDQLFDEAVMLKKQDDLAMAEKKYIKIIGLDSKNIRAFEELGRLYFEQKSFEEAKQAFEHVLKLKQDDKNVSDNLAQIANKKDGLSQSERDYIESLKGNKQNAQTFYNLALVYQALNSLPEAINSLKEALEIEPNNPRYLDIMLELSIITKDKMLALDIYDKLVVANLENKKIELFKKQIDEL